MHLVVFYNVGNFYLWNPGSWDLESGIQLKESQIPLMVESKNPSSMGKFEIHNQNTVLDYLT